MHTAEQIFNQAGLKSTSSRLEVAAVLIKSKLPQTHQEILRALPDGFDRVTLYRVLDWLLKHNVIHRVAGEDRAWRFQINTANSRKTNHARSLPENLVVSQQQHAHFKCAECGKVFCLENIHPKLSDQIPSDFVVDSIELNIRGTCNQCHK